MHDVKRLIAEVLNETADILASGKPPVKVRVGVTLLGSELGAAEVLAGAEAAQRRLADAAVVAIGPVDISTGLELVSAGSDAECHARMEELLAAGELDAAVTMHYNFPIGVATVGLAITPGRGGKMFIASTTGTAAADRVEAMVRSAVHGIAAAKAYGIAEPAVGILNVDGARQAERCLAELKARGYDINFAVSGRSGGGAVMRGNDLLAGTPQVLVTDSLTGNLLMKIFSAYTTGGGYESLGYGYGPGIGKDYDKIIHIVSRASGAPVIAGAVEYAVAMVKGRLPAVAGREIAAASGAGLDELAGPRRSLSQAPAGQAPPRKTVSEQIAGIDVLELENAQRLLWDSGIYAETGMGCTGPVALVAPEDLPRALAVLQREKIIAPPSPGCGAQA